MTINLWDSRDLYMLREDLRLDPIPDYFQRRFFSADFFSADETIKFADLPVPHRKLAPFVMPTSQGKPIFERKGEKMNAFQPAYIKVKDAVRVVESRNVLPSQIFREGGGLPSLQERFDMRVAEVAAFHIRAINMQKAWMSARAFIDAEVTVSYHADQGAEHPEVTIQYGRAASLEETATATDWNDPDFSIINLLTAQSNVQYKAQYGGRPTELILGADMINGFTENKEIKELLNTQYRGSEDTVIRRGINGVNEPMTFLGRIGGTAGLDVYTYKDTVEAPNGTPVDIMSPSQALLIAPGAGGVMAHGAIYDIDAFEGGNISADIFPKMFKENDPGDMYVMHQSAPLPVNVYPNRVSRLKLLS